MPWEIVKARDLTLKAEAELDKVPKEQQDQVYRAAHYRAMKRGAKRVAKADILAVLKEMNE